MCKPNLGMVLWRKGCEGLKSHKYVACVCGSEGEILKRWLYFWASWGDSCPWDLQAITFSSQEHLLVLSSISFTDVASLSSYQPFYCYWWIEILLLMIRNYHINNLREGRGRLTSYFLSVNISIVYWYSTPCNYLTCSFLPFNFIIN